MTRPVSDRRLLMGAAAVLTVRQACELLPGHHSRARAWLERHGLVRDFDGTEVVVWGSVLDVLEGDRSSAPRPSSGTSPVRMLDP